MPAPDPDFTRFAETGDAAAFRAVVDAHLTMVHAVAWRQLGEHSHLAADVAQRVFTRLAKVACGLPRDLVIAAWLHRQAVRLAIDSVRAETRRRTRESTAAMLHSRADDTSFSPPEWQQIAPLLDEALDRLPAAERAALVLRYLEDRDFAGVGTALKITPEAARKRVARGLEKLRVLLSRRGVAAPAAALSAGLLQAHSQAQSFAASATQTAAASGVSGLPAAAAITKSALANAAAGSLAGSGILTTFLMSHLTSVTAGAALALLAAGLFYQHQEAEIQRGLASLGPPAAPAEETATVTRAVHSPLGNSAAEDGPKTLAEIIDALEAITKGPDTRLAKLRIAVLLKKIPPADYLAFYTTAEFRIPKSRWRSLVGQSISSWEKLDPASLTKALFSSDNSKPEAICAGSLNGALSLNSLTKETFPDGGSSYSLAMRGPFSEWLGRDFAGAMQWASSQRESPLLRVRLSGRFGGILYDELESIAAGAIPAGDSLKKHVKLGSDSASRGIGEAWAQTQLAGGKALSDVIKPEMVPFEVHAISRQLAISQPERLRAWVEAGSTEPSQSFEGALALVNANNLGTPTDSVRTLAGGEILQRAQFALRNAGAVPLSQALSDIAENWIDGSTEGMPELLNWIQNSGPPEEIGRALNTAARRLAESRSPWAMEFATSISDSGRRDPLMRGIFLRWQDADPLAAGKYMETASPAIVQTLKTLTNSPQP